MAKRKKAKDKFQTWVDVPDRGFSAWLSDWLVSSMMLQGYIKGGGRMPKRIRVPMECMDEQKDGSALLHFEVQY